MVWNLLYASDFDFMQLYVRLGMNIGCKVITDQFLSTKFGGYMHVRLFCELLELNVAYLTTHYSTVLS